MALGDVVNHQESLGSAVSANALSLSFTPTKGNLLVFAVTRGELTGPGSVSGWTTAYSRADDWGGLGYGSIATYWKIADGTETSINMTNVASGSLDAYVVVEYESAGYGWKLSTVDATGGAGTGSLYNATTLNYNNSIWPNLIVLPVHCAHTYVGGGLGALPDNPITESGAPNWGGATFRVSTMRGTLANNGATKTTSIASWMVTADQAADVGGAQSYQGNSGNYATLVFDAYDSPFFVDKSALQVTTTTSCTPDISAKDVQAGDLVVAHCVSRNSSANAISAPSGEGWSSVSNINRAVGTGFVHTIFAKIWGVAGNTDDTTPTFTIGTSGTLGFSVVLSIWRNNKNNSQPWASVSQAIIASATDNSSAASATPSAPSCSWTSQTDKVSYMRIWSTADDNNLGSPSAGTLAYGGTSYHTTTGDDHACGMTWQTGVSGSGSPSGTATLTEASNGNDVALTSTHILSPGPLYTPPTNWSPALLAPQRASRW